MKSKKLSLGLILCAFVLGDLLAFNGLAAEFHVTDRAGFTSALDAARISAEAVTIFLAAGTYSENFTYIDPSGPKSLTIRGEPGTNPKEVILDAGDDGTVFKIIVSSPSGTVRLEGLTIQHGSQHGLSVLASDSLPGTSGSVNIGLTNVILQDNTTSNNGGGIFAESHQNGTINLAISNSVIRRNQAPGTSSGTLGRGGGIFLQTQDGNSTITLTVINSLISKNQANWSGGGIEILASNVGTNNMTRATVINSTIADNEADIQNKGFEMGGGIRVYAYAGNGATASLELYNSIIYGNTAKGGTLAQDLYVNQNTPGQASLLASHCNIKTVDGNLALYHPTNVINSDPLLVDPDHDDYHLAGNSPCINAGTASVPLPGLPETDFEGDPRTFGPAPDIGADEVMPVSPDEGTIGTAIYITGSGFGTKKNKVQLGNVALKIIKWADGYVLASLSKALSLGTYDITVFPKGASSIIFPSSFNVKPPEIYSVSPNVLSTNGEMILQGFFFGSARGKVTVAGKNCRVVKWTMVPSTGQSEVRFILPKGLSSGDHELKITNGVGFDTSTLTIL